MKLGAKLRDPVTPILAVVFLVTTGMGMVWSILAIYAESLGASATMVGVMIASFGGIRLVVNVPAGLASERFGRNRTILVGLLALAGGSFAAIQVESFISLLICLVLQGIGSAVYVTAALAAVADLGTAETRVRDMGAFQAANLIGLTVGPGLGGLVAAAWGYTSPFVLQGGMALAGVLAISLAKAASRRTTPIVATAPPGRAEAEANGKAVHARPLPRTIVGLALMTYGVMFTRISTVWILLPLVVQQKFELGLGGIGLMLTAGAIANLSILPLTTVIARRFGYRSAVIASTWTTVLALLLLTVGDSVAWAWCASILLGAGSALVLPTLSAYAANAAPPKQAGAAMGLLRTINDVAVITGPIVIGAVIDRLGLGYHTGIAVCAAVLIAVTAVFVATVRTP